MTGLAMLAAVATVAAPLSYRLERAGEASGSLVLESLTEGWVRYEERRGEKARRGALRYDADGAIVAARFHPAEGDGMLEVRVVEGKVELSRGGATKTFDPPPTLRTRFKEGRAFVVMWTLAPPVLLGAAPLAAASSRADVEVGAVIVDPDKGLTEPPVFRALRLERERRPRTVELASGASVPATGIDVSVDGVTIVTLIVGEDGTVYAYRIVAKDSPRYGETGLSSLLP